MTIEFPNPGFVFWPVGTGDSSTICIDDSIFMQVDINHLKSSESDDDERTPVADVLRDNLPKKDEKPYLSCFVLTHPDKDHCRGFARLLDEVTVGELWFSPRIFWEYHEGDYDQLCDDAKAFFDEAERRVNLAMELADGEELSSGDKVRIIGYADVIKDYYADFPSHLIAVPGHELTEIDGEDKSLAFRAFINAPFKDDCGGDRNNTSVGMQVTLKNGEGDGKALFLGDLGYGALCKVFKKEMVGEPDPNVYWDLYLATHHCSKGAMYVRENGKDVKKQDILDAISTSGGDLGYIVLSCDATPSRNNSGDNPPHAIARNRYEEIAPTRVICTMEEPSTEAPEPIVFEVTTDKMKLRSKESSKSLSFDQIAAMAAGLPKVPAQPRSFGNR
jgi:hypothetical protein